MAIKSPLGLFPRDKVYVHDAKSNIQHFNEIRKLWFNYRFVFSFFVVVLFLVGVDLFVYLRQSFSV